MNTKLVSTYAKYRATMGACFVGRSAQCSLSAAKTILAFQQAEADGLVRMRAEPEEENYFDVFGLPEPWKHGQTQEQATKEQEEILERFGCWWTVAEWFDGEEWQAADSCGMHTGYRNPLDPFENCYVVDEMRSALDALVDHQTTENEAELALCWP